MATAKEIKEKVYFEEVYNVLDGFKMRLYLSARGTCKDLR